MESRDPSTEDATSKSIDLPRPNMKTSDSEIIDYNIEAPIRNYKTDKGDLVPKTDTGGFLGTGTDKVGGRIFNRHTLKYSWPSEVKAFPLRPDNHLAPEQIKSNPLIRDFSYFFAKIPFTITAKDDWIIPEIIYEAKLGSMDGQKYSSHIPSFFPPASLIKVGTKVKRVEVKGNLALKIPDIPGLGPLFGISITDAIQGAKEWSESTLANYAYDIIMPRVAAGTNGDQYVLWKFSLNQVMGEQGGYEPSLIFGIPKDMSDIDSLTLKFTLSVNGQTLDMEDNRAVIKYYEM